MAYQYKIEITLADDTTEEIIIHSDNTLEYVGGPLEDMRASEIAKLRTIETSITGWMIKNNALKVEIKREVE
jgi:hypothetical protein